MQIFKKGGHRLIEKDTQTAQVVSQMLIDLGFLNVKAIRGGYDAWVTAGYPLVTGP